MQENLSQISFFRTDLCIVYSCNEILMWCFSKSEMSEKKPTIQLCKSKSQYSSRIVRKYILQYKICTKIVSQRVNIQIFSSVEMTISLVFSSKYQYKKQLFSVQSVYTMTFLEMHSMCAGMICFSMYFFSLGYAGLETVWSKPTYFVFKKYVCTIYNIVMFLARMKDRIF